MALESSNVSKSNDLDANLSIEQLFDRLNKVSKRVEDIEGVVDSDVHLSHVVSKLEEALDGNTSLDYRVSNLRISTPSSSANTDEKVKIAGSSTAGYLGAAGTDGVLRVDGTLTYTNGGNYATLSLNSTLKSNYDAAFAHIHNLTTDIDHNQLTNTHNLTTDVDHNSIANTHNLTTDIDHNAITNAHDLTTDIDHNSISNTHNLTTDIDHDNLTNVHQDVNTTANPSWLNVNITAGGDLRLHNPADTYYTGFKSPALSASQVYTLPLVDGSSGEYLQTNGSGVLIWAAAGGGGGTPGGATTNVQYNNAGAFGGDANFTYDGAGKVFASVAYNVKSSTGVYQIGGVDVISVDATGYYFGTNLYHPASSVRNVFVGNTIGSATASGAVDNIGIGTSVMRMLSSGDQNVCVGADAGELISSGKNNTCLGGRSGGKISTYQDNTFVGYQAGANAISSYGTYVGSRAGIAVTTGARNLLFGYNICAKLTTGSDNVSIGSSAGAKIVTATGNIFLGTSAGGTLTDGGNVLIGYLSGSSLTSGGGTVAIGYKALDNTTSHIRNTVIGYCAAVTVGGELGHDNVIIGYESGYVGDGVEDSVIIGFRSGYDSEGRDNVYIGSRTGENNTAGDRNVFLGTWSGEQSGDADNCVFIGYQSGQTETNDYRLYIESSSSSFPLIYGEFDNDILRIHGNLEYKNPSASRCDGFVMREPVEVTTSAATQTTLDSITLLDENTYHIKAFVTGVKSDGSERASYEISVTVYRTGAGNATIQGAETILHAQESDSSWNTTFTISGNDVRISVTGVAATTIQWSGSLHYINTSN